MNRKDFLWEVHRNEEGNPKLTDTKSDVELREGFYVFKITGEEKKDALINAIYGTAKLKDQYEESKKNYDLFKARYIKEFGNDDYIKNAP